MTFRDDILTDRAATFLTLSEFAETVAYRVASTGVSSNIPMVFEDAGDSVLSDGALGRVSAADVAAPVKGDQYTRDSKIYTVTFVTEEEGMFALVAQREEEIT